MGYEISNYHFETFIDAVRDAVKQRKCKTEKEKREQLKTIIDLDSNNTKIVIKCGNTTIEL